MIKKILLSGLMVVFLSGTAMAVSYGFEDMIDSWGSWGDAIPIVNSGISYTHDITDSVDFIADDYVTGAYLELDFTNDVTDDSGSEYINLDFLGGFTFYWDYTETASYAFDGSGFSLIDEVDNGQYDLVVNIDWLNDDGLLDVELSVSNPLGTATAWLDHSRLYGTAETAPVPEPGTIILLGIGLTGLAFYRRKKT